MCLLNGKYFTSDFSITNEDEHLHRFILDLGDYGAINEENIIFFNFALPYHSSEHCDLFKSIDFGIPEENDFDDLYLLLYRLSHYPTKIENSRYDRSSERIVYNSPRYDCLIFKNFKKIYELKNITSIDFENGISKWPYFDYNDITFRRSVTWEKDGNEIWHFNGKIEACIKPADLRTFYQWCIDNNRNDLIDNFISVDYITDVKTSAVHWFEDVNYEFSCPYCGKNATISLQHALKSELYCFSCREKAEQKRCSIFIEEFKSKLYEFKQFGLYDERYLECHGEEVVDVYIRHKYTKKSYVAIRFISQEKTYNCVDNDIYFVSYHIKDYEKIKFLNYLTGRNIMITLHDEPDKRIQESWEYISTLFHIIDRSNLIENNQLYDNMRIDKSGEINKLYAQYKKIRQNYREIENEKFEFQKEKIYSELISEGKIESKWVSELHLFKLIQGIYPDTIYQYRPIWLEGQSLDIYIPNLNIGIEYQGIQHYKPVDFFGGEKGLSRRIELDKKKKQKCDTNNVTLIYWDYNEPINENLLYKKINQV